MKIFWSWQSDIDGNISRHFIKECLIKAVTELKDEAIFDSRVEIDHDTKDIPGSPPITDTILEKIKNCSVFIADVTPVAFIKSNKKKIMNPNVAIETGYAIALVGNHNIISIMNESFGSIEDLPFDLRYKRGPVTYTLKNNAEKSEIKIQENELVNKLKIALKNYISVSENSKQNNSLNLDINGPAIFFDPGKPIFRLPGDGWGLLKDKEHLFKKAQSYIYTKIVPLNNLNLSKTKIKKAMFDGSNFKIVPLLSKPDNTPDVNRYGVIVVHFNSQDKNSVNDFVQVLENGGIVSISNSSLFYSKNKIYLINFKSGLEKNLKDSIALLRNMVTDNIEVEIEIGLVNGNDCSVILPNPIGNKYYPEPERGPLEKENYILKKRIRLEHIEKVSDIVKEFILSLLNDLGVEFNYEEHKWH